MMAAAAGRRPAAGEGVEHAEPERGPGRGRDVIAPGRAIERRMDGATKGQIDELVTAAGAVVGRGAPPESLCPARPARWRGWWPATRRSSGGRSGSGGR